MSKFKTHISVDLDTIKQNLPPRSFVNGIRFDGERVIVEWENDDFRTPYTTPMEWQDLAKIPAGVLDMKNAPKPAPANSARPVPGRMNAPVSGQQTSSQSPVKGKPDDAANVKKKPAGK
jgi:hypothetical protein